MRKLSILLLLCVFISGLLAGCAGVVDSADARARRTDQIDELQTQMLVDDWDYLWLRDRSTKLTRWHPRVGR